MTKLIWIESFFDLSLSRLINCTIDDLIFKTFNDSMISKSFWSIKMNEIWSIEFFDFFFRRLKTNCVLFFFCVIWSMIRFDNNDSESCWFLKKFYNDCFIFQIEKFVWFFSCICLIFDVFTKNQNFWIQRKISYWNCWRFVSNIESIFDLTRCDVFSDFIHCLFHSHGTLNDDEKRCIHFDYARINIEHEQRKNQFVEIDQIINDFENHLQF